MGAYRRTGWLKAPLAGAAWAALGLAVAAPGAPAQSPARGVEVWYGLERVSGGEPPGLSRRDQPAGSPGVREAPPKPAPAATGIVPGAYVLPAASYPFTPDTARLPQRFEAAGPRREAIVPAAHWGDERTGGKFDSASHGKPLRRHAEAPRPEAKAEKPTAAPSPPPEPAAPVPEAKPHPAAEGPGEGTSKFLYRVALVQVLSVLGSLAVGPLVLLLSLPLVLRRFKVAGSLLRVEVVNSGTPAPAIARGGGGPGASLPARFVAPAEPTVPGATAQPFDPGPSYEEERRQSEEAERLRERAVLQHVYEDNVRLLAQLGQEGSAVPA